MVLGMMMVEEIYKKAELSDEKHKELIENKLKTEFLTSIFNIKDLDFLLKLGLKHYKDPKS